MPISSKLVADLMKRAGADSVMMLDPHTPQLEGFFNMPTDALQVLYRAHTVYKATREQIGRSFEAPNTAFW